MYSTKIQTCAIVATNICIDDFIQFVRKKAIMFKA